MRHNSLPLQVAAAACAVMLSGCAGTLGHVHSRSSEAVPPVDRTLAAAAVVAGYLETLQRLVQGAPAQQAEILAAAQREYELAPTPSHQLHLALVLAAPNHAGTNVQRAQKLLRELLATPETLMPAERALAFLELSKVDQQIALATENRRLQSDAERADRERLAAANRRLQLEIDENARLRQELKEVRAKLDAIATIERSINERKPGTEGRTP